VFKDADERLEEERKDARDRDQLAEARAVEVILGRRRPQQDEVVRVPGAPGDPEEALRQTNLGVLAAAVINHGRYVITGVEAHLFLVGGREVPFSSAVRVTGDKARDEKLLGGVTPFGSDWTEKTKLTPWDTGLSFASDPMSGQDTPLAYVVVRWTDQWGTQWENQGGRVQKAGPDAADG
jgi:hypothetical protein